MRIENGEFRQSGYKKQSKHGQTLIGKKAQVSFYVTNADID